MASRRVLSAGCALLWSAQVAGACPDDGAIAAYVADFAAARTSAALAHDMTLADAECARGKLVKALPRVLGRVVGYKAGFTNPAVQARLGVKEPAWGVMFERNIVRSGARIPARAGARLHYEADLIVVVKDAGLAEAGTPLEVLQHLEAVMPFIELPDLMTEARLNGIDATGRNILFRGGVTGPRVKVIPSQAFLDSLAGMTVVVRDGESGKELGRSRGDALMGHPVHAAMWLAAALKRGGIRLQAGDLLSLGAYTPLTPVTPGSTVTATYFGLGDSPSVSVTFDQ